MKTISTARKFQLITKKDLFAKQLEIKKVTEAADEDTDITTVMDFVQYGLYLALYEANLTKAKQDFAHYLETFEMDCNGQTLNALFETWAKEIK